VEGLAQALDAVAADDAQTAIVPADRSGPLPLSFQQERLWFLSRLDASAGAAYAIACALRLSGRLDVAALAAALHGVVERHESLRTRFAVAEGHPVQVIEASDRFALAREDASALSEAALTERVASLAAAPFDLALGPLFRAHLLRLGEAGHILVVGGHHTVLDGWSIGLLLHEVSVLYAARRRGEDAKLPVLAIQYADYAAWQRASLSDERLARGTAYWREQLRGAPVAISLPTDRSRPATMDYRGGEVALSVPADVTAGLTALARSRGATLFMVLQAAFAALLHRMGGGEDMVIGTAIADRGRVELETLAGFFVNTLALRHRVRGEMAFTALLDATREVVLSAFEHQAVPFGTVVEAVSPVRSLSHAPLLQVMLVLQNQTDAVAEQALALPEVTVAPFATEMAMAHFELSLSLTETMAGLVGTLSYASALFDPATAQRLAARFGLLLAGIAAAPEVPVADLPLMDAAERNLVVSAFNATAVDYPRDRTVLDLFEAQVVRAPEAIAVVDGDREVGYGALAAASRRLGRYLIGMGVGPEVVVGVCLDRSVELLVSLLGVFQAGGAYLPLDPAYPEARLGFMLADAQAPVVITTRSYAGRVTAALAAADRSGLDGTRLVVLDDAATATIADLPEGPVGNAERTSPLTANSLAYVIYTSGSTGRPKGAMIGQRELTNFVLGTRDDIGLDAETVVLSLTSPSFDVSMEGFCVPLAIGGRVVLADRRRLGETGYVRRLVDETGVTMMHSTPAVWRMLTGDGWRPSSRMCVLSGGEVLSPELANELCEGGSALWNSYGPSETTVTVTTHQFAAVIAAAPIGSPRPNTQAYVVDARFEPQPVGVAGELLIGGLQVGRGYLGRPGLTAERFVADPFSGVAGSRLYRTGDQARWRADGSLEFMGRLDQQVKIRGMRVELGEIEAALDALPGIARSVVVAQAVSQAVADMRLVAYLVPTAPPSAVVHADTNAAGASSGSAVNVVPLAGVLDLEAARVTLKRMLPEHMVPSGYVGLSRLPMTASGKIDRNALPTVETEVAAAAAGYVAPRTVMEALVAAVFAELLGVPQVGVRDGFFDLGGHSLLAVRVVSRLAAATSKELPVRAVFEHPTVEGLAQALGAVTADKGPAMAYQPFVELVSTTSSTSPTERPKRQMYCVHPSSGHAVGFARLIPALSGTAGIIGLQAKGMQPGEEPFATYEEMCATYVDALQARVPAGPIHLLGWSLGGYVAHDVACRLSDVGRDVPWIVILDSVDAREPADVPAFEPWLDRVLSSLGRYDKGSSRTERLWALAEAEGISRNARDTGDVTELERLARLTHLNAGLLAERRPSRFYPGRALIVRAADTRTKVADPALGWGRVCGAVHTLDVSFDHLRLLDPEPARLIGEAVASWINAVDGKEMVQALRCAAPAGTWLRQPKYWCERSLV